MPVLPKPEGGDFTPVPQGNHVAICYRIIDLGTQDGEYMGKKNRRHKVLISWEIPDELMDDGRPFTIGQRFTWSMADKAALRGTLESWRGKAFTDDDFGPNGFDIKNILGVPCMLNVVHETKNGKTYSNITSVAKLPKGVKAPAAINKPVYVWLSKEEFERSVFDGLTDGLKKIIEASPEYHALSDERVSNGPDDYGAKMPDDEIPF